MDNYNITNAGGGDSAFGGGNPGGDNPYGLSGAMLREWRKMVGGEVYEARMEGFAELLAATRVKLREYNAMDPRCAEAMAELLRGLLGSCGEGVQVNQPFRCDYGRNIHVGRNFFANFNLTILDEARVEIGDNVMVGPNVSIYTACHPLDADERATWVEWAEPVTVGNNVWIGGSATLLPGVVVGDGAVVAAGAVVTRPVEAGTLVGGNPARLIRRLR